MCIFISTEFKKKKRLSCPLFANETWFQTHCAIESSSLRNEWSICGLSICVRSIRCLFSELWTEVLVLLFLSFLSSENLFSSENKDGILLCCYHIGEEICLEEVGTLWFSSGMWIVRLIFLFVPCNLSSKLWRLDSMNDIASHLIF